MARGNASWECDRIADALANLGHCVGDQTVGNLFGRGMESRQHRNKARTRPARNFIAAHLALLAGTDFFIIEVLTWRGLVTSYGQDKV